MNFKNCRRDSYLTSSELISALFINTPSVQVVVIVNIVMMIPWIVHWNVWKTSRQTSNCHDDDAVSRRLPPPSATSSRVYPTRIICNSNRIRGIASDVDETTTTPVMNSVRPTGNDTTPSNVQVVASIQTRRRIPWTRDDYKELMWCYYQAEIQDVKSEKNIFNIWRSRNPHIRPNMTPSSQRRFIIKNTKLTNDELATIKANVSRELGIIPEDVTADLLSLEMLVNNDEIMESCLVESHNEHCSRGLPLTIYDEINTIPVDQAQVSSESTQNITNMLDQGSQYVNLTEDQLLLEGEIMNELSISLTRKFDERVRLPKVFESHKLNKYIADSNVIIEKYKHSHPYLDLTKINHLIYAVATVVTRKFKNIHTERSIRPPNQTIPKWQKRIERKINEWRKEISILCESKFPRASDKVKHKTRQIKRKYRTYDCIQLDEILKQKISAYAQRISRYKKRNNGYKQNKMFNKDKKRFYRMLMEKNINIQNAPNPQDVQDFWSELWGTPSSINQDAMWIKREEERMENTETMSEFIINHVDLVEAIQNTQNWKAPGWDSIQNFWIKKLHACHEIILKEFNMFLENPDATPFWMTVENTFLIPKNENTGDVKNYRPITCLPVLYKLLTSIVKSKMYKHLIDNNILPMEQRGCLEGATGCKDLLMLDKIITEDCKKKYKNLSVAWIDLLKAYDNCSHEWMVKVIQMYKIDLKSATFCERIMKRWRTRLIINTQSSQIVTDEIQIRKGIYQGDSLSPLLFCMALIPLSAELERINNVLKLCLHREVESK
ncbi:hypothetical protein M8J77_013461 [Diaphorina citri]|nr:hypothetical protein M8J77_013461 [Diaphorina citri]